MQDLGDRIKYLRELNNWTQTQLCEKTGLTKVQLSRYETNDRKPDPDALKRLADALDTTSDYLLGRTDNKRPIGEVKEESEIYVSFIHGKKTIDLEDEEELELLEQQLQIFREYRDRKRKEREQQDK